MNVHDVKEQAAWPPIDPDLLSALLDIGIRGTEAQLHTLMQATANSIAARAVHLGEDAEPRVQMFGTMLEKCTEVNVAAATGGKSI